MTADAIVTAAVTTEPKKAERFALDGYRAVAAVMVLVFHAYQFNRASEWPLEGTVWHFVLMHSDLGVDMFFVLSGLLLGLPFAKSALGLSPPRSGWTFLTRRFARLLPLYFTVVLLVWSITNPQLPGDYRDLLLHLTFTHVYTDDRIFYTNGPAWTLACEVHFFILLAILGTIAQRGCRRLSSTAARYAVLFGGIGVLMAVSLGYLAWAQYVAHIPVTSWSVWFNPLAKLNVFAIGLVLGVVAADGRKITARWGRWSLVLAAAGVVALAVLVNPDTEKPSMWVHTLTGLACVLILASSTLAPVQPRWLGSRAMMFLGTISYGIYLWQEPTQRVLADIGLLPTKQPGAMFLVTAVIMFAVTVAVAWVSYHVIERTTMRALALAGSDGRPRDYYPDPERPPAPT